jgi:hypothetical protein
MFSAATEYNLTPRVHTTVEDFVRMSDLTLLMSV